MPFGVFGRAGSAESGEGLGGGGRCDVEGARSPLGVLGADLELGVGMFPVLFRDLLTGRDGSAMLGGPFDGLDGLGRVVVMSKSFETMGQRIVRLQGQQKSGSLELRYPSTLGRNRRVRSDRIVKSQSSRRSK